MIVAIRSLIFAFLLCLSFVVSHETAGSADRALAARNVLARYAIEIDNQNWDALEEVFTEDIVANYTGQDGKVLLNGIPAIQDFLRTSIGSVNHQHAMTTQLIEDDGSGARVTTYFTATFFGKGNSTGTVSSWGKYMDELAPQANGKWKILSRDQSFMGPYVGDLSIFS